MARIRNHWRDQSTTTVLRILGSFGGYHLDHTPVVERVVGTAHTGGSSRQQDHIEEAHIVLLQVFPDGGLATELGQVQHVEVCSLLHMSTFPLGVARYRVGL